MSIFSIPVDVEEPLGEAHNFLSQYGVVTLTHIQAHALTYADTETRAAQDSVQLGLAIMKSVSVSGFNKLSSRKS
jgi:hypothetical protein